jgi:hypothetical protein
VAQSTVPFFVLPGVVESEGGRGGEKEGDGDVRPGAVRWLRRPRSMLEFRLWGWWWSFGV